MYRRAVTFAALAQHLASAVPCLPPCPTRLDPTDPLETEALRKELQQWMRALVAVPQVPATQVSPGKLACNWPAALLF